MPKIFFVGATGRIGGTVLQAIVEKYQSKIDLSALVRDKEKGKMLVKRYARITLVVGSLEDLDLIEAAANEADIVINCAWDIGHEAGIKAIIRGLAKRPKGYYIHTSGAAAISDEPSGSIAGKKIWDDVTDIAELTSLPDTAYHRVTDKIVLATHPNVNTAIISPGSVYGIDPLTEHPPMTFPWILPIARQLHTGFTISEGINIVSLVHLYDLARLFLLLVSNALGEYRANVPQSEIWGPEAYYFAAAYECSFRDFMTAILPLLKERGIVKSETIEQLDLREAQKLGGRFFAIAFGTNMRIRSSRAKKFLKWQPEMPAPLDMDTLKQAIELALKQENQ
ncbi:MAG: hypothetical protein M1834_000583 [Cirrosporium novae-zelandiae]|nr:MAG: hypothetical protein M1834_000583 [Cirrosporium novae-zelandiae]